MVKTKIFHQYQGKEIGFTENTYIVDVWQTGTSKIYSEFVGEFNITNPEIYSDNFYKVKIELNPGITKPKPYKDDEDYGASPLGDYLVDILNLQKSTSTIYYKKIIPIISYDTSSENSNLEFNKEYLIVIEPGAGPIDTNQVYKSADLTIRVSKADPALLPYVKDPDYCEQDNDCSIGSNFCSDGSYNKFRGYAFVYGCEGGPNYVEEEGKNLCPQNQAPVMKYTGSKCINNKCLAQNGQLLRCETNSI